MMERASRALESTEYFDAERLAWTALRRAAAASDFERMARIVMPLLEARRQKRQIAASSELCVLVKSSREMPDAAPGCYLFQPPMIGIDARNFREAADSREVPVLVITREPMTR